MVFISTLKVLYTSPHPEIIKSHPIQSTYSTAVQHPSEVAFLSLCLPMCDMLDAADSVFYLAQLAQSGACRHQTIVAGLKICLDMEGGSASKVNSHQQSCSRMLLLACQSLQLSDSGTSRQSVSGMDTRGLSRLLLLPPLLLSSSSSLLLPPSSPHLLRPSTPFFSSLLLLARSPHGALGHPRAEAEAHLLSSHPSNFLDSNNPPASK